MVENIMIEAKWDDLCLCCGKWTLIVDGKDVSDLIPNNLRNMPMGTYGTYVEWYFDENMLEVWKSYEDGFMCDEWIKVNKYWLDTITYNIDIHRDIYLAIKRKDFRLIV